MSEYVCQEGVVQESELQDIGVKSVWYDGDKVIISFEHPELGMCHFNTGLRFKYCPYCGEELKNV